VKPVNPFTGRDSSRWSGDDFRQRWIRAPAWSSVGTRLWRAG